MAALWSERYSTLRSRRRRRLALSQLSKLSVYVLIILSPHDGLGQSVPLWFRGISQQSLFGSHTISVRLITQLSRCCNRRTYAVCSRGGKQQKKSKLRAFQVLPHRAPFHRKYRPIRFSTLICYDGHIVLFANFYCNFRRHGMIVVRSSTSSLVTLRCTPKFFCIILLCQAFIHPMLTPHPAAELL